MELKEIGEFGLIDRISENIVTYGKNLVKGVGDDCSVFMLDKNIYGLITTDLLVENVHFLTGKITPEDLGYKSLAVNLSDIAAMGGVPHDAYISIAIPEKFTVEYLDRFYSGIKKLAGKFSVNISGGDTTNSKNDFIICFTVYGTADNPIYRSGSKAGDKIFTTGFLGDSAAGLNIILNDLKLHEKITRYLIKAHNHPEPKIMEGRFIAENSFASSMIDLSDGLASDLKHICSQSMTGAVIYEEKIPVSREFNKFLEATKSENFHFSFTGGEDYQLLFTVPEKDSGTVKNSYFEKFGTEIFEIGEIVKDEGIVFVSKNGDERPLTGKGYDHFKKK
ncbi:thiamine-phosphate kinase [candidate division KSB1 bacterium]